MRSTTTRTLGQLIDAEDAEQLYKQVLELKVTASEVLETALTKLKDELCDGVALKLPNRDKQLVVETYA